MRSVYWACAIENAVAIICFTIIAVVFGKWWIALFAALCLSWVKT